MLFNSYLFIFAFLPIMLIGYFWLLRQRLVLGSKVWLVGGSFFFYGYWNVIYVPLLLGSILVNFFVGSALSDANSIRLPKKKLLLAGIVFNIALLAYFKYTDFLLDNFNGIFGSEVLLLHIILPLGISFFTFTQIAFLVDAYKEKVKEYDLLNYMLFVTYFPHLLAGPILHHAEMMPQFLSRWNWAVKWRNAGIGLFIFSMGLFKKVVIADTLAEWANTGFDAETALNFFEAWATSLSYSLQLYFDFSGYTDMAIGISLMFNIRLPINFNSPYKAKNIQDFWRRWHITLSRFLRDYIYIPLGGNQVGRYRNYGNLFAVFLIGGLWHGASWMFVIWGALHGIAIVIHRIWRDLGFKMWGWLGWFVTFNFVNIAWVFFRAENFGSAERILYGMAGLNGVVSLDKLEGFLTYNDIQLLIAILVVTMIMKNSAEWSRKLVPSVKYALLIVVILLYGVLSLSNVSEFLYFQF